MAKKLAYIPQPFFWNCPPFFHLNFNRNVKSKALGKHYWTLKIKEVIFQRSHRTFDMSKRKSFTDFPKLSSAAKRKRVLFFSGELSNQVMMDKLPLIWQYRYIFRSAQRSPLYFERSLFYYFDGSVLPTAYKGAAGSSLSLYVLGRPPWQHPLSKWHEIWAVELKGAANWLWYREMIEIKRNNKRVRLEIFRLELNSAQIR